MSSTATLETNALQIFCAHDETQLRPFAPSWNALARDVPFLGWDWTNAWWHHYRPARGELCALLVTDEHGEVHGIAPWYLERSRRSGRVLRFLGSGEVCSDYLGLMAREGFEQVVAERIADWLSGEAHGSWDLLDLTGVEATDTTIAALCERLEQAGHRVDRQADLSCWRTDLPGTWDEFLATLSKSRREKTRALLRRAVDNGRATLHQVTNQAELDEAFPILIDLHQKRRRSLSQAGCFASPRFTSFHREVAARLLECGQLRLLWTELEGRPIAAEYGIVGGRTVYYYQGGFDPELADERPGWLSFAASLRLAVEQGYQAFDFLRGDESYKASWRAGARPLVHIRVVGGRPTARARFAAWRACQATKQRVRQLLSREKDKGSEA